jgi:inward rectifier potassium channel
MLNSFEKFKNKFVFNTGFADQLGDVAERFISKKGKGNVRKIGFSRLKHISLFHTLIDLNIYAFWIVCFVGFVLINIAFGCTYYFLGADLILIEPGLTPKDQLLECFYFSAQTLTAVGYGRLAPTHNITSMIASFEAFFGLMSFAVITGLLYARFSKPRAHIEFSKHAIIRPFRGQSALMFRLANYVNNDLTDVSCEVIASFSHKQNNETVNRFIPLALDISRIQALVLNWTVVHIIDEKSPLFELTKEDIEEAKLEIIIIVKGYDEYFSTYVQERNSYLYNELLYDVQFVKMYYKDIAKKRTILDIDKLSEVEEVKE